MSQQLTQIKPLSQPVRMPDEIAKFSPEVEAEIDAHLAKYPVVRSAILPLMFIVQRERGYLDPPGVSYLANRLNLRITDIWEVATFYSMIQIKRWAVSHQVAKHFRARSWVRQNTEHKPETRLTGQPRWPFTCRWLSVSLVQTAPMFRSTWLSRNLTTEWTRS